MNLSDKMSTSLFFIFLIVFCSCSLPHKRETDSITEISQLKRPVFFLSVPFTKLSSIQAPCLDVAIEGKTYSMELDLGFRGAVSIEKEFIDQILKKTLIRTTPMYGIRGKEYLMNFYQIPKIQIGSLHVIQPILQEESLEFLKDSTFNSNGKESLSRELGRVGWELFYNFNLLIDVKNSEMAFCDSLDTLKKRGYLVETFTKCPLHLERGLVEFETETPEGKLLCMLDTGSTFNMFNSETEGKSIDQIFWDPENRLNYDFFKIEGNDFGPIVFRRVPIHIPIRIEAVIGMEFIEDHLIFIDFANKLIYFAKNTDN